MYTFKREMIAKLASKFWTTKDIHDYPIVELKSIDWDSTDKYIRTDFDIYRESVPEDYYTCTMYSFRLLNWGVINEIICSTFGEGQITYYWIEKTNSLLDRESYENWEAQAMGM